MSVLCCQPSWLIHFVNHKAVYFNRLIVEDLVQSFGQVSIVHGQAQFLNSAGRCLTTLYRDLNKDNKPDHLHLNESGLRLLSVLIKDAIFLRKRSRGKQVSGRTYANALSGPRPGGRLPRR